MQYLLVFAGCVLAAEMLVGDNGLFAMLRARQEYQRLQVSLARARALNAALRDEARRYHEDRSAIEAAARNDLGMIKPGELLYIIRDNVPDRR